MTAWLKMLQKGMKKPDVAVFVAGRFAFGLNREAEAAEEEGIQAPAFAITSGGNS